MKTKPNNQTKSLKHHNVHFRMLVFLILNVSSFNLLTAQEGSITNITVAQRTDGSRLVDVWYDLTGDENFSVFTITAEVSYDGGETYQSITMLIGDIGGDIAEGAGKCFVWDFGTEAGELYTANAKIRLTANSEELPPGPGECVDYDGNSYETVQIGDQLWMAENLKVTHYNNGDEIQYVQSESSEPNVWENLSTGAYGYYNDDLSHLETYGNLYNWYAVDDARGICPEGWHVPTDEEYQQLEIYLGMEPAEASASGWHGTDEGGKMKETGTEHWNSPNTGATNESGFTGLPAGYRFGNSGNYYSMGYYGYFWSSSENFSNYAWYRRLNYNHSYVNRYFSNKQYGFSVRCAGD